MNRLEILVAVAFTAFAMVGCGNSTDSSVATEASTAADAATPAAAPIDEARSMSDQAAAISVAATPAAKRGQQNAARSAQSYLAVSGFSRDGLINQLSSDAGHGYDAQDAKAAVDSLNVDWNEQAKRSAEQYLSVLGLSCKSLVEQLSSDAADRYTKAQAEHGARAAGACG